MADETHYRFKINNFTPESMPFGRLVEYYSELMKLLGGSENVHLVEIFESSHGSALAIDHNYVPNLNSKLQAIENGTADRKSKRAFESINKMLADDNTSGSFADQLNNNIVQFKGVKLEEDIVYRVRDSASFIGKLYSLSTNSGGVKARIETETYGVVFCNCHHDLGKALRSFFDETVKVSGRGMWKRTRDGSWKIDDFTITDYKPVELNGLRQTVDKIRAMGMGVKWPTDLIGTINEIEERNGGIN